MIILPFHIICTDEGFATKWQLTIMGNPKRRINGTYDVIDFYCIDPSCDCQKVTLSIVKNNSIKASVSYGWKSAAFYRNWGVDQEMADLLTQGFLDPYAPQSKDAEAIFNHVSRLLTEPEGPQFFKDRYTLFKKTLNDDASLFEEKKKKSSVIPFPSKRRSF
jgi:hypothetical protein